MASLVDKVVVVTGAAQGIGVATESLLAAQGTSGVLLDLPESEGSTVAEEITRKGDEAFFVAVDVRNEAAAVAGATDSGYQTVGRIDVLVKVAWIIRKGPGASLSAGEPLDYLTEEPFEVVIFDAYLMDEGNFELRDTDGSTLVSASFDGSRLGVTVGGAKRTIGLRLMPLPGAPNMEAVSANGVELGYVEGLEIVPDAEAGWARDPDGTVRTVIHRDW